MSASMRLAELTIRKACLPLIRPAGFTPTIDRDVLAAHEIAQERFAPASTAARTRPCDAMT